MKPPVLQLLSDEEVQAVLDEAFQVLQATGIKVMLPAARAMLAEAGARVDEAAGVARLPEALVRQALATAPDSFALYHRDGQATVRYGGDAVHFDPGSAAVNVLDGDTGRHRPARTADLIQLVQLAETLAAFDAQSTAVVCSDVPAEIADIYRLYLVLLYSEKPVVTGGFATATLRQMIEMLALVAGGAEALAQRPLAVFDVCPSPPLIWSEFGAQSLIDLARAGVPAELVSMPLAGAAAPVTLLGAMVQHAAECLGGIVIHQLARPGAPIVWGGAPAIFDMRHGTTPMGAVETAMIDIGYTQVGKALSLPTHTYLGASDAKLTDAQAGLESGMGALLGGLAGINMISGAGMLDFLACQSAEKLVIDAEIIGMVRRLLDGVQRRTTPLATAMLADINFRGDFLKQPVTRQLFRQEQFLPSPILERASLRSWQAAGESTAGQRARQRVTELLAAYRPPAAPTELTHTLDDMMSLVAAAAGLNRLPARP